jgi:hypothetical protein
LGRVRAGAVGHVLEEAAEAGPAGTRGGIDQPPAAGRGSARRGGGVERLSEDPAAEGAASRHSDCPGAGARAPRRPRAATQVRLKDKEGQGRTGGGGGSPVGGPSGRGSGRGTRPGGPLHPRSRSTRRTAVSEGPSHTPQTRALRAAPHAAAAAASAGESRRGAAAAGRAAADQAWARIGTSRRRVTCASDMATDSRCACAPNLRRRRRI